MLPSQTLPDKPPRPFRGAAANLTAFFLVRPKLLRLFVQYVLPLFQRVVDLSPDAFVTTHRGVFDVMDRDDDFPIGPQVGPAMVCGTFVLGTDRVPLYREDLALLWEAFYEAQPGEQLPLGGTKVNLPGYIQELLRY